MAHNAKGELDLRSRAEQWTRRGAPVELLTGKVCQEATGTTEITSALLDHRAGTINPMAYTSGLAAAVTRLGGQHFDHSPVKRLERQGSRWCVTPKTGRCLPSKSSSRPTPTPRANGRSCERNFFPGYYYQVASAPLTEDAAQQILPGGQGSWDTRQVLSSIRRDADGRLLLGSLGNGNQKPGWFLKAWADRVQQHYFPYLKRLSGNARGPAASRLRPITCCECSSLHQDWSPSPVTTDAGTPQEQSSAKHSPIICAVATPVSYPSPLRRCSRWRPSDCAVLCMRLAFRYTMRANACRIVI